MIRRTFATSFAVFLRGRLRSRTAPAMAALGLIASVTACNSDAGSGQADASRPSASADQATGKRLGSTAAPVASSAADSSDVAPEAAYETIAGGLEVPRGLAFASDGRIFVAERPGRIRVIEAGRLLAEP